MELLRIIKRHTPQRKISALCQLVYTKNRITPNLLWMYFILKGLILMITDSFTYLFF